MEKWVTEENYGPVLHIAEDGESYAFSLLEMTPKEIDKMVEDLEEGSRYLDYCSSSGILDRTQATPYYEWRSRL